MSEKKEYKCDNCRDTGDPEIIREKQAAEIVSLKTKVAELEEKNTRLERQLNINQYDLDGMASEILNGGE